MSSPGLSPGAEAARLAVLRQYRVLDTPPEAAFDDLTRLAAEICGAPMAALTLVDERREWSKSSLGLVLPERPREWSFCAHAMLADDLFLVRDTQADERFAQSPYVIGEPFVRFYAGAPLRAPEGHPLGALSVSDRVARELDSRQLAALRALAREAQAQLDRRRAEHQRRESGVAILQAGSVPSESEERFRQMVELSADAIVLVGHDATFRFVSTSTTRVLGHPPADLVGQTVFDIMHPDDVARCRKLFEYCLEHPGEALTTEFRFRHKDGSWRLVEADGVNRLGDPAVAAIVANFRDVTQRRSAQAALRASEERFRLLADNLDAVFWVRTPDLGRVLYVSPMYERIFGRSVASLCEAPESLLEVVHPEDRGALVAALADQANGYDHEYRILRPDSEVRWIHSRGYPARSSDGVVIAGISLDVTERKRAEEALRGQTELVANLLAVARATTEQPNLEKTLRNGLDVMGRLTASEGGSLLLLDEDGRLTARVFSGGPLSKPHAPGEAEQLLDKGLAGWVARHKEPALVADTLEDSRWLILEAEDPASAARSALCVPFVTAGSLTGVLTLVHSEPRHFTDRHLTFIQAAGEQLALALRNAQFVDALGRLAARQRILYEVLRAAGGRLDPDEALTRAVEAMARRTGWEAIHISVPSEDRKRVIIRASTQGFAGRDVQGMGEGIVGRAFATGQTQLAPDVTKDPDYLSLVAGIKSELAVPIRHGDRTLGVLNIESDRLDAFRPEDVRLAESLTDAVALALASASLHRAVAAEGERLSSLIEASRDGVLFAGVDGTVHVMNEPARRLLGLSGVAPNWLGRPVGQLVQRLEEAASPAAAAALASLTSESDRSREGEIESPAGVVRYVSQAVASEGSPLGRLLILRDVTEERRVERLREDLSHTMVHDLRSPLTSILGSLEVLEGSVTGRDRDVLELAGRAARRLLALVDAILDVSRLEKGLMPLKLAPVSVERLLADVIELQDVKARQDGLRIAKQVSEGLPLVLADPDVMARVVQNLVGNAVKFGGRNVRVLADLDDAGRAVRIRVEDDGPGIAADLIPRLFQKFVTGDHRKRGSGLGLAFCKLAVEAHGGRIRVESTPGQGARFSFTLAAAPGGP